MTKNDIIIIWLSLSLLGVQYQWLQAEKKAAYLAGELHMINWQMVDDTGEGVHKAVPKKERW